MLWEPTLAGSAFAALGVAGGAPWFSDGLRALRLRRHLDRLSERPLAQMPTGFVQVRGRVTLDSPLFGPVSGKPCAGYRLVVRVPGAARGAQIDEHRTFRLVAEHVAARVRVEHAHWAVAATAERHVPAGEALGSGLEALIERSPEARWARATGRALSITEHALLAGSEGHVIGHAQTARPFELPAELEWARTGTDDQAALAGHGRPGSEPDLWVDAGGHLEFLVVADQPPVPRAFRVSPLRLIGVVAGPILSLAGLLYLANAADRLQSLGRF